MTFTSYMNEKYEGKMLPADKLDLLEDTYNAGYDEGYINGMKFYKSLTSWHNLIKEPEKLPEYDKVVEIWIKGMNFPNSACRESLGGGQWRWWVYWGSGYEIGNKSAVIAWREIEKPQF